MSEEKENQEPIEPIIVIIEPAIENEKGGMGWQEIDGTRYPMPPPGVKVLRNGAGYDLELKRIGKGQGPGTYGENVTAITRKTSGEMQAKGKRKRYQLSEDAMDAALSGFAHDSLPFTGLTMLHEARISDALGTGRNATAAYTALMRSGGFNRERESQRGNGHGLQLPPGHYVDKLQKLLDTVTALKEAGDGDGER